MSDQPTCGRGVAANAALPAALGKVIGALAGNLDVHQRALDLNDPAARQEHDVYAQLVAEQRQIASALETTTGHMTDARDIPMGNHDMQKMTTPEVRQAFDAFVQAEEELLALLRERMEQDRAMLQTIVAHTSG